jgi:hypothetical protein
LKPKNPNLKPANSGLKPKNPSLKPKIFAFNLAKKKLANLYGKNFLGPTERKAGSS